MPWIPTGGGGAVRHIVPFSLAGEVSVIAGQHKLVFREAAEITAVTATVGTAPSGDDLIVDVHLNGTTIFTDQGDRPIVEDGETVGDPAVPAAGSVSPGDYLTVDVDQVGSGDPGEDLTVVVEWEA